MVALAPSSPLSSVVVLVGDGEERGHESSATPSPSLRNVNSGAQDMNARRVGELPTILKVWAFAPLGLAGAAGVGD
jgi:hypothetical protein